MKQYWMVEEDLSWIDWIKVGTVIDRAITKRICVTCTTQTSFGQFVNAKGSESYNDWAKAKLF
jgi:hypothetical protein